ncbi:MAG: GDSL-type esterase/lipase family protein [Moraxella sp.]|nr:GDSL-type esterase/lipase family protein [Moraxella sp.]
MPTRRKFLTLFISSAVLMALPACSDNKKFQPLSRSSTVIALGDSLTFGYGADKSADYPSILSQKTGWKIDNMGTNGNTTADVLNRLDTVIAKKPKLVLLGIGGNDVLRRVNSSETKNNLVNIINTLKGNNIDVVLIAQPHLSASALFGKASDNPVYKEVAKETDIPLLSDVWSDILSDDKLKSDKIHANNAGYAKFADELYQYLKQIGYAV